MLPSTDENVSAPAILSLSRLTPTPRIIAVYASPRSSPSAPQHSLPGGRYPFPGPDFHRLELASFSWRTSPRLSRYRRARYERPGVVGDGSAKGGIGARHGHRERGLLGTFGATTVRVPRARLATADGKTREWRNATLPAYQRRTKRADALIAGAYLSGTNTRRVRRALAALFGGAVGKDTVSRVWRKTKGDWDTWMCFGVHWTPIWGQYSEPIDKTALGGHVERCEECGVTRIAFNSCRDRHCPKCQGLARLQWLAVARRSCCPFPISMSSSPCPRRSRRSVSRTRRSSMTSFSRRPLRPSATSPRIPNTWTPRRE